MRSHGDWARRLPDLLLALAAVVVTARYALVAWRRREPWDAVYPYRVGVLTDFRDTVMLPWRAIDQGVNPYDIVAHTNLFPHAQEFDPYAPWWLTATHPFARLGWDSASLLWSLTSATLITVGAFFSGRLVAQRMHAVDPDLLPWFTPLRAGLAMALLAWTWRPTTVGHGLGNVGALAALCAVLALMARRDGLGALLLALAWVKPQFGIPLALALLARGQWRRAALGTVAAALASLPMTIRLAQVAGGLPQLVTSVLGSVEVLGARTRGEPMEGRVDAVQALTWLHLPSSTMTVMAVGVVVVMASAVAERRLARAGRPALGVLLLCLAVLVGFPHLHYDLPMLLPALAWVAWEQVAATRPARPSWLDGVVSAVVVGIGLLGVAPLGRVGLSIALAESVAMVVGFLALVAILPWTAPRRPRVTVRPRRALEAP